MSSHLPSTISLKLRTVSLTSTYLPGEPVNVSATKNGCDRNFWILRARETVSKSSSDSSSMLRMAMMSTSSLYFYKNNKTTQTTTKNSSPTTWGDRIVE